MLKKPSLAKCSNRNIKARVNLTSGEPDSWFDYGYLNNRGIEVTGFDFFVNWNTLSVPNEIWIKRIIDDRVTELFHDDFTKFYSWICDLDGATNIDRLTEFCNEYDLSCKYFLFKDSSSWKEDPKAIYEICITNPSINVLKPSEIQRKIQDLRKVAKPIGSSGLFYGTSSLECYLSYTPFFWPGDVDAFLIDRDNKVRAILEYKKHNLDSPIEHQTLLNYRNKDCLKYQSLGLLRDRFKNSENPLPIIMIYYPTNHKIKNIKIEKINGMYNDLKVTHSEIWDIPIGANERSQTIFTQKLLDFI